MDKSYSKSEKIFDNNNENIKPSKKFYESKYRINPQF